ncbi:MAG: hypothetical protein ABJO72_07755 [Hyphomicrobiales bacterium]
MTTRLLKNSMSVIVFGALSIGLAACNTTGSSDPKSVSAVNSDTPIDTVSTAPIEAVSAAPIDDVSAAPIDIASAAPIDGASDTPIDIASDTPIDREAITSSITSTNPTSNEACPPIEILDGTATLTAYASESAEKPENTLHQAVFIKTNSECTITDGILSLTISAAGRAAKGPKSFSDSATLPIRIAVVSGENDVLFSQLYNRLVHFSNEGRTQFSIVEKNINVPFEGNDNLKVLIGFDTLGSDEVASKPNEKSAG